MRRALNTTEIVALYSYQGIGRALPPFGPCLAALLLFIINLIGLGLGPLFTDAAYIDGEFAELFLAPLEDPRVLAGQLKLLRSVDFDESDALAEVHRRIRAPVLCIWGPEDPFFPVAKARAMLPQFTGPASLVEIPRGKLFAHEDRAEEFLAHALPFLRRSMGGREGVARSA